MAKILVVDDDPDLVESVTILLEKNKQPKFNELNIGDTYIQTFAAGLNLPIGAAHTFNATVDLNGINADQNRILPRQFRPDLVPVRRWGLRPWQTHY